MSLTMREKLAEIRGLDCDHDHATWGLGRRGRGEAVVVVELGDDGWTLHVQGPGAAEMVERMQTTAGSSWEHAGDGFHYCCVGDADFDAITNELTADGVEWAEG